MALNEDQRAAAAMLPHFLVDDSQKFFHIRGPGGSGKSHMIRHILQTTIKEYIAICDVTNVPKDKRYSTINLTATTNPAAAVLSELSDKNAQTIHSLLGLTMYTTSTGKDVIRRKLNAETIHREIIIIDESSYISRDLLRYIHEGTEGCKIIFVSDHCQLAPVGEAISPIYELGNSAYLNKIERTDIPEIQKNNYNLRNAVDKQDYLTPIDIWLKDGVVEYYPSSSTELMEAETIKAFTSGSDSVHVVAFTNDCVTAYAQYIRNLKGQPAKGFSTTEWTKVKANKYFSKGEPNKISIQCEQELEILGEDMYDIEIFPDTPMTVQPVLLRNGQKLLAPVDLAHWKELESYAWNHDKTIAFSLKNDYISLRSPEAMTAHKSQGSTFDEVFIDLHDLTSSRNPNMFMRLLYVAASRAKKRVCFFGSPQKQYQHLFNWRNSDEQDH